jgi:uncharacterized linocin/CFP29 family protein
VNHLLRGHAPITETGWAQIDEEARGQLTAALAARKLVDFAGPKGWDHSATGLGHTDAVEGVPGTGLVARQRRVLPVVELRADFAVGRQDLLDADRGALDVNFDDLDAAAQRLARAENVAVLHGWAEAGIAGVTQASSHGPIALGERYTDYPAKVAQAVQAMLTAGVGGPYGLALGPEGYTGVVETTEHGGLVVLDHLREILGGPVEWSPGVHGAVVVSLRGGDFLFESGQDLSVGYDHLDADQVHLYIEESFTFRVVQPEAGVSLTP